MRVLIDLQGAQNDSKNRGIGRYTLAISQAIARNRGEHEVLVLLNAAFPSTLDGCRSAFADILPPENIVIFNAMGSTQSVNPENIWRRNISELLYEHFALKQAPDVILICDPCGGWGDQTITSICRVNKNVLVASILYDLIPLIHMGEGDFNWPPTLRSWYFRKLDDMRRAHLLLSISESSKSEAIKYLGAPSENIANIRAAADSKFHPIALDEKNVREIKTKYSIQDRFIVTASAIEKRKNPYLLIYAFARLSSRERDATQLLLVGGIHDVSFRVSLLDLARNLGLSEDRLLFAGHIPDEDLIALYSVCDCFVFPSTHEGFGLPPLEAMACGAPVLVSNATSLPEVVGWEDLLFDPQNADALAIKLEQILIDNDFRQKAIEYGLQRSREFSWDRSAFLAWDAFSQALGKLRVYDREVVRPIGLLPSTRLRLAYVSPLPGAHTSIADYSAELLPELSRFYDIDVIVHQNELVDDDWVEGNARIRSLEWLQNHAQEYDRVLYQLGNSEYHTHMFALMERYPGIVVLHDFNMNPAHVGGELALLNGHGWPALERIWQARKEGAEIAVVDQYPCNLAILQQAIGIIVHSNYFIDLGARWYGREFVSEWSVIPQLRAPVFNAPRVKIRDEFGLEDDSFLVCAFGDITESNQSYRLIESWLSSSLMKDKHCRLVFVGEFAEDTIYEQKLRQVLRDARGRIRITGRVDKDTYRNYLVATDLAVQLSVKSQGEIASTVLDCMNYAIAIIANANNSLAELPENTLYLLGDGFQITDLCYALEKLYHDSEMRLSMGRRAAELIHSWHHPHYCADRYAESIESSYARALIGRQALITQVGRIGPPVKLEDMHSLAGRIASLYVSRPSNVRNLFIDISMLVLHDAKTGVQRVTRNVLRELLRNPPDGYRVEPVYSNGEQGYRYARNFTAQFLKIDDISLDDSIILARCGDIFWGLDLVPHLLPLHEAELIQMRALGVKVVFTVHDILPLTMPQTADQSVQETHQRWLLAISRASTGLICVSQSVAENVNNWLRLFGPKQSHDVHLGWAHNGADIQADVASQHSWQPNADQMRLLGLLSASQTFLMVGTVEPRKGHRQVLAAFDWLWAQGIGVNLVIVGKEGWRTVDLVEKMRVHPQRDLRLFWLQGIDDDFLEAIYAASTCLLAASLGEGFGLPLIEAARHGLRILARDIPVFREVAGRHATYFSGLGPYDIGLAVLRWLDHYQRGDLPDSDDIPWLSWEVATRNMLDVIVNDAWQTRWSPSFDSLLVARYWGGDYRVQTAVGERIDTSIVSTGYAGCLAYGPHGLALDAGHYLATWRGRIGVSGSEEDVYMDVSCQQGRKVLHRVTLENCQILENGEFNAMLPISLKDSRNDVEVRVWVGERSDISLDLLEIKHAAVGDLKNLEMRQQVEPSKIEGSTLKPIRRRYWATHPRIGRDIGYESGRYVYANSLAGVLTYGPYEEIPAGRYVCQIWGQSVYAGAVPDCWMDVSWDKGRMITATQPLAAAEANVTCLMGSIVIESSAFVADLELRVHVGGKSMLRVDWISIEEIVI